MADERRRLNPGSRNARTAGALALCLLLGLAACDAPESGAGPVVTASVEGSRAAPPASEASAESDQQAERAGAAAAESRYTSLEDCELVRFNAEGGGYSVQRCPGVGGVALQVSESDGRQDVAVVSGGREHRLNLPGLVGAGFSTLGPRAEWRGGERPSALIVRYAVVEDPETPERPVSYLVAVALEPERACVVGKIAPGPRQNEAARRAAEAGGPCLEPGA